MTIKLDFNHAAWFVPCFLLNILFLGTSHALSYLPISYWAMYQDTMSFLSIPLGNEIQTLYDVASLALTVALLLLSFVAFRECGIKNALLRMVQIGSLSFLPLGAEVLLFDHTEWNLNVAQLQVKFGLIPWFSNADLFLLSLGLAAVSSILLTSREMDKTTWKIGR